MTSRRRFLAISAAAVAVPQLAAAQPVHTWQGVALGARATLRLAHPDAAEISARVASEISRLEDIFSLYRQGSTLMTLNRTGVCEAPPFELLACLSLAGQVHAASGGRFDPTVQPLWESYAKAAVSGGLPAEQSRQSALARTGWQHVELDASGIFMKPGMALTLNGIAQGYIADRVADMLAAEGLQNVLIDTGEVRALGSHPNGRPWPVKLAAGGQVPLEMRALATSAPLGTTFDEDGKVGHIIDPRTGKTSRTRWREISISARSAALADALSTAGCLFETQADLQSCVAQFPSARVEAAMPLKT